MRRKKIMIIVNIGLETPIKAISITLNFSSDDNVHMMNESLEVCFILIVFLPF